MKASIDDAGATTPSAPTARTVTPRRFGICPDCQTTQLVRRDGLVGKHPWPWVHPVARCGGSDTTPLPVSISEPTEDSTVGVIPMSDASRTLDRWDYLALPLRSLLMTTRTELRETAAPYTGFRGAIRRSTSTGWWGWVLWMPIGQDPLERDLVARGLLATAHGVDVTDWPTPMADHEA